VSDDQTFGAIWLVSLLLMVLAAALPLAPSNRAFFRNVAIWLLIGGFLLAFYRIGEWLLAS
jgi:hypothetical protein